MPYLPTACQMETKFPLSDAQQTLRIMGQHAAEWNIQQVGIMGSSADGHLPALLPLILPMLKLRPISRFFLSSNYYGPDLYPHGISRQPAGKNPSKELERNIPMNW